MKRPQAVVMVLVAVSAALAAWAVVTGRIVMIFAGVAILIALFHRSIEYEIAAPFRGWVIITYGKPDCPPLKRNWLSFIVQVDRSGRACTSDSNPLEGPRRLDYVYIAENGRKIQIPNDMIHAEATSNQSWANPYEAEFFFVGTAEALKKKLGARNQFEDFQESPITAGRENDGTDCTSRGGPLHCTSARTAARVL
jgi:hypothetical protein